MSISFHQLLKVVVENGSSDLHITAGSPPMLRIDGKLGSCQAPASNTPETKDLCYSVLTDSQKHRFEENWELDFLSALKHSEGFVEIFICSVQLSQARSGYCHLR